MSSDDTTLRQCSKCKEQKPLEQFTKHKQKKDGISLWCRACNAESCRRRYADNREADTAASRHYYAEHKDSERERHRKYRAENKGAIRERRKKHYAIHREKHLERNRKWASDNHDWVVGYSQQYYIEHRDKLRVQERLRRAREFGATGSHTLADLDAIRAAQTDRKGRLICWRCGNPIKDTPHLDHWIPLAKGGSNDPGNLHYMHAQCNLSKNAKHPTEIGRLI